MHEHATEAFLGKGKSGLVCYYCTVEDDFFGERKHEQNSEEKRPKELRYYWR